MVGYTARDITLWSDLVARTLYAAGVGRGDLVQNAYGYGLFTGGLGYHYGAERLGATVLPTSSGQSQRQLRLLLDLGTTVLCATPTYLLALAELAEKMGVTLTASAARIAMIGGEPCSAALRTDIEGRWRMTNYG